VALGTRSIVDVVLKADARQLSEVVVTGYTTQNKREVAGSVATIKSQEVANVPLASFDQALQGKAPGILVQANSGQPGAAATVLIRGKGSVLGGSTPLYVLDGVEITAADFSTLNPADFESFSVLKDASSTSLYGSRGANGVIVITSKKGIAGKTRLNYDFQYGLSNAPENKLDLMNSSQKLDYEVFRGNPYKWTADDLARLKQIDTDWGDVFFKTGKTMIHTLNASGGTDKTTYFLSGSVFDQTGTVPTTGLKRYTGRANVQSSAGDFNFGLNSTFGYSEFTNTSEDNTGINTPLNAIRWTNPYETPYDADGNYTEMVSGQPNALQSLLENNNLRQQYKGVGNVFVAYSVPFLKGLTLKTNWGADFTANEGSAYVDPSTPAGASSTGGSGSYSRGYGKRFRYTGTNAATYTTQFNTQDHNLTLGLFNEVVKSNSNSFFFTGYGLGGPFENEAGITPGNASNGYIPAVGGNATDGSNAEGVNFRGGENSLLSYFSTLNYGFKERYFLSLSGRRDGSSRFGVNRRYANFGSAGVSWIVTEENFMAGLKDRVFNELKLKVSYGSAGNQAGIGSFQSRELYSRAVYNGVSGLVQSQLANPELQWERKTTFNAGLEFATLDGRVRSTIEYYNSLTTDLFLGRQLSRTSGYTALTSNIGELQNRGVEFSLEGDLIKTTSGFTWTANVSLTRNQNEIKKLVGDQQEIISGTYINRVGESMNSLYLVRYAGVNPANGNAQFINKEGAVTEVYSPSDRVIVGTTEAPFFGGFGSTLNFKGFEASAFFSFVKDNKIFNNDRTNVENPAYYWDNVSLDLLNTWKEAGQITDIPRPGNTFRSGTTHFVENGDFLRLRNVNLSYTLPQTLVQAIKLRNLRVFVQGQNLVTWTDFKGWDPEMSFGILQGAQYPAMRTMTFGVSVGL
jgi:TonB-linked SusC/RagA family outer membrane protein